MMGGDLNLNLNPEITFRYLTPNDKQMLFEWRNTPEIVLLSTSQKQVSQEEHSAWFDTIQNSDYTKVFIIEEFNFPIGQVRFDRQDDGCQISIYLLPGHTGKGRGSELILTAIKNLSQVWKDIKWIDAHIRSENIQSIKAFEKAGFRNINHMLTLPAALEIKIMRFEIIV